MSVLRAMYGPDIPEPEQILFKRWHSDPLFRGSYSNWGTSYPPALFDDLRAPLEGRLWFAGEATSFEFYGFLQVWNLDTHIHILNLLAFDQLTTWVLGSFLRGYEHGYRYRTMSARELHGVVDYFKPQHRQSMREDILGRRP